MLDAKEMAMTEQTMQELSDWMTAFVDAGNDFGAAPTLRECMTRGDEHGDLRVTDASGEHRLGSRVYEDAFLTVLQSLVKAGEIAMVSDAEQKAVRDRWFGGDPCDQSLREAILEIQLRQVRRPSEPREKSPQEKATDHLLSVLKAEGSVQYSRFYNHEAGTEEHYCNLFGIETNSSYGHAVIMDDVVRDLVQRGIAAKTDLLEKLADGELDYLIALTDLGREYVDS